VDSNLTNTRLLFSLFRSVGTGMSYTNNDNGFVTNQSEVGADLLNFLYQFYTLYPAYQNVPLYICGESYAGKYIPAFAYAIHQANAAHKEYVAAHPHYHPKKHASKQQQHTFKSAAPYNVPNGIAIPLAGISIGDGMMDPVTQVPGYGSLLFGLSLIDEDQRAYMEGVENNIVSLIQDEQYLLAFQQFDPLMMGDEFPYGSVRLTSHAHRWIGLCECPAR
jgi:vitellogenic carboxypeptidase-like protein